MIYTSIDLGSNSLKIVVALKNNDKFYVLASTSVKSKGIKKGYIKDRELVIECLKEAIANINKVSIILSKIFPVLISSFKVL